MIFNKIFLFTHFHNLIRTLREPVFAPSNTKKFTLGCGEKIALGIRQSPDSDINLIRMWHTNTYFGIWHNNFASSKFLAALDYRICEKHIKIEYMNLYDEEYIRNNDKLKDSLYLNKEKANELNNAMLEYVKNQALMSNKSKVIVDVHRNLRIFDAYYKSYGFVSTERRCKDNPYWVEAELSLD